ncbi:hypothetical protein Clacol_003790 [Clathrus columnatus]|uniref:Serine/threonine-protein kinase RIO1 n=1 Tax=Clathrus columnatus TaxID=1419009 RepID=A0AAV5A7S8_9AGAM|nr:hypothetical protein Clacol_003790 [Clathrus columnatus]
MSYAESSGIAEGQFEDAQEIPSTNFLDSASFHDSREGHAFIDDEWLQWSQSDEDSEEAEGDEAEEVSKDGIEEWDIRSVNVDDEDWEIAERDFTKQYNRLRQHLAVRSAKISNAPITHELKAVPLPAINRSRTIEHVSNVTNRTTDQLSALAKYAPRIALIDQPYGQMGVSTNRKGPSERANYKDKSDRATNEQVLDPRTRLILFKMIGRGTISEVNGCISTGKEANVYHALNSQGEHIAVKIFKTSILIFKDRDRYVTGERRFRRGYSKHNPRKMVRLWAEKEMRNLKRLVSVDIPCPEPIEVRENVLLMRFLGTEAGWASPRLKDAEIPEDQLPDLYKNLLLIVHKMFHECKLVHADLSEYNILYHQSQLFIIDVGQSVEHDHPSAFDFLRSDLKNVEEFFSRRGVPCLGVRRAFEFVIGETSTEGFIATKQLDKLFSEIQKSYTDDTEFYDERQHSDDKVFMQSYIPRSLDAVYDPERDVDLVRGGEGSSLIYSDVIGIVGVTEGMKKIEIIPEEDKSEEESSDTDATSGDQSETFVKKGLRGHRNEDKEAKKLRKQAVKDMAREKRKHKMSKAEKKRRIKATRPS